MILIACGTRGRLRKETADCPTCGCATVQLLSYSDNAYWGTDRICSVCGTELGEGNVVDEDAPLKERLAEISSQLKTACECPEVFWEGELEGGLMYAPCKHELARGMTVEMADFLVREVGGIVKVGIGLERERRGPVFDALPVGTVLDDGEHITMAAMKRPDGTWETQGQLGHLEVRQAFMYGRVRVRQPR